MSNDIDTNITASLGLSQQKADKPQDRLGQQDFLELMITQLRNQDPFKPMDSSQFLGQLAQFGTVSGISDVQTSLQNLTGAVRSSQTLQAASLVNRNVWVAAQEGWLPPDGSLNARVDVPEGATDVSVDVYDLHGQLVAELPVNADDGASFEWDGSLPKGGSAAPGFYELRAKGQVDGKETDLDTLVAGRVESVSTKGAGDQLSLTVTGVGVVDLQNVRGID